WPGSSTRWWGAGSPPRARDRASRPDGRRAGATRRAPASSPALPAGACRDEGRRLDEVPCPVWCSGVVAADEDRRDAGPLGADGIHLEVVTHHPPRLRTAGRAQGAPVRYRPLVNGSRLPEGDDRDRLVIVAFGTWPAPAFGVALLGPVDGLDQVVGVVHGQRERRGPVGRHAVPVDPDRYAVGHGEHGNQVAAAPASPPGVPGGLRRGFRDPVAAGLVALQEHGLVELAPPVHAGPLP